jgi:hypothetical protein
VPPVSFFFLNSDNSLFNSNSGSFH